MASKQLQTDQYLLYNGAGRFPRNLSGAPK